MSLPMHRRPGFLLALGLCVIGGAVTLLGRLAVGPQAESTRVPLPNVAGTEGCPSFSPNGRHLAYSGKSVDPKDTFHVWVRALPTGAPQQLTLGPANDICPVWSPDGGSLAFLRVSDDEAQYVVLPSTAGGGGSEHSIASFPPPDEDGPRRASVAWLHDGKSLLVVGTEEKQPPAIYTASLEGGKPQRLTRPPAGSAGDSLPSVSPDGQTVAFFRGTEGEAGDIWLCDPKGGGLRQLTFDASAIRGITWTADGHDVVYATNRARGSWQLFRIPAFGGSPREVMLGAREINDPAIAPAGRRLAYTQTPSMSAIWVASLPAGDTPHTRPILRSAGREAYPSWSPDGKQIAFVSDESGTDEIWVSDAEGNQRAQVTGLKGPILTRPRWSPDGKTLLFSTRGMQFAVYTIAASSRTAKPKPLPVAPGNYVGGLSWSHDGKSVYAEWRGLIWKFTSGGEPKQITDHMGAMDPEESADGKYVYYWFRRSIWRVPSNGGPEEEVASPDQWVSSLEPTAEGIYYMGWERRREMSIRFFDFEKKRSSDVLRLNGAEISRDSTFDVSPDGKYLLYPKIDRTQTDLVLVENFH